MPSIKDCFIFTPNNGTIVDPTCTAFDRAGKDTYNGTVECTRANAHDLATAKGNGKFISYHYDMDGVRDSKTVDGVKHEYITQGGNVTF